MKDLIHIIRQDYKSEGFTRRDYIIYGILSPIALIALCILAESI